MQDTPEAESQKRDETASEEYGLSKALVKEITRALEQGAPDSIRELVFSLHVADLAELFNLLAPEEREQLTQLLGGRFDPEILTYLNPEIRDEVLDYLGAEKSAEAIAQLDTDDAVSVMEDLSKEEQEEILEAVPDETREELIESLAYPESSAGRLMRRELVAIPEYWTVGDTIDFVRSTPALPDDFYVIFVTDPKFRPIGSVLLSRVMQNKRDVRVRDIMNEDLYTIQTETDQEEVAHIFRKYGLVEAPVINEAGRLVGVITVDDVVDVIQEEGEEDLMLLGGVTGQDLHATLWQTVKWRFPWLFINLLTAFLASRVIDSFEESISKLVTLAVLMPIIASMGGNAGYQAVTVVVRAIATKDLQWSNALAAVRKELCMGGLNGLLLAAVNGLAVYLLYKDQQLALVFAAATLFNMLLAGLAGALIPLMLHRMRIDPAVASGVFLTTLTDMMGFFSFLGLATWLLL